MLAGVEWLDFAPNFFARDVVGVLVIATHRFSLLTRDD
jgi:hypothetical protein